MKIIRVFPRKTNATPTDELAVINRGPLLWEQADEVHVSVTFTWDVPRAEKLWREWSHVADCRINGPALGHRGEDFIPGQYLKVGHVITSRGCPNVCSYCSAWKREGTLRELPITGGYILHDNNILACSREHQEAVFEMLARQAHKPRFTGGLEAARLTGWHIDWLLKLKPDSIFFAYDEPADYEPLCHAAKMLRSVGILGDHVKHRAFCYVLIGRNGETFDQAEKRLKQVVALGFMPQAMLYNRQGGKEWKRFQREWAGRRIVGSKLKTK